MTLCCCEEMILFEMCEEMCLKNDTEKKLNE